MKFSCFLILFGVAYLYLYLFVGVQFFIFKVSFCSYIRCHIHASCMPQYYKISFKLTRESCWKEQCKPDRKDFALTTKSFFLL